MDEQVKESETLKQSKYNVKGRTKCRKRKMKRSLPIALLVVSDPARKSSIILEISCSSLTTETAVFLKKQINELELKTR